MAGLWDRVTRVDAIIWFGIAALLTAVGYVGGEDALWPFVWLVPNAVILFGLWRGSRIAWAVLVSISAILTIALAMVCVGMLFGSGFFLNIYWWGPTAHGAALLFLVAFRASRQRASTLRGQAVPSLSV